MTVIKWCEITSRDCSHVSFAQRDMILSSCAELPSKFPLPPGEGARRADEGWEYQALQASPNPHPWSAPGFSDGWQV